MNFFQHSLLLITVSLSVVQAQQKTAEKPQVSTNVKAPAITCSEPAALKGCRTFKQLLEAHDRDILDSVSSPIAYVCFRSGEDAFLIFRSEPPSEYGWKKLEDGGETQEFTSAAMLTEYRDGVFYRVEDGRGYWRRYLPEPVFHSEAKGGLFKGLKVTIDDTEISIEYPFRNDTTETTNYSLIIRRSTGRFIETYAGKGIPITHSGTCLIYR